MISSKFLQVWFPGTNADELTFKWPLAVDGAYCIHFLIWEIIPGKHGYLDLVMTHMLSPWLIRPLLVFDFDRHFLELEILFAKELLVWTTLHLAPPSMLSFCFRLVSSLLCQ